MKTKYCWMWMLAVFVMGGILASKSAAVALETGDVFGFTITEIMYDVSGADTGKEWIELRNDGDEPIVIQSDVQTGEKYTLPIKACVKIEAGQCSSSVAVYSKLPQIIVEVGELVIMAADEAQFRSAYPDYQGTVLESRFSLTNKAADNVIGIFQESKDDLGNKQVIWEDQVVYASSWGGAGNGKSLERTSVEGEGELVWVESVTDNGTPGQEYQPQEQEAEMIYPKQVFINELLPDPAAGEEESIELVSKETDEFDLEGWSLKDASGKKYVFPAQIIAPGEYVVITYSVSKISLNNSGDTVTLYDPRGEQVDSISYDAADEGGKSYARNALGFWEWTPFATLGADNQFEVLTVYRKDLIINEILPNLKGTDAGKEWIELRNIGSESIDLQGWVLMNKAKKKFVLFPHIVNAGEYVVIHIDEGFSISNSEERLQLLDPRMQMVDETIVVGTAKEDISWNRTKDNQWRWSRFVTPGKKNRMNKKPQLKFKLVRKGYINVPLQFDASKSKDRDKDGLSFSWDFGDGGKSSASKVTHTFKEKGTYTVRLVVSDGSEEVSKKFKIKVREYPRKPIYIVKVLPNPSGKDTGGSEMVELMNLSSRDVKLKGYMMYLGKDETVLRRYVIPEMIIPGQGRVNVSNLAIKFSLPNEAGIVSLRYPDGEEADNVEYVAETALEGQMYVKKEGQWQWIEPDVNSGGMSMMSTSSSSSGTMMKAVYSGASQSFSVVSQIKPYCMFGLMTLNRAAHLSLY